MTRKRAISQGSRSADVASTRPAPAQLLPRPSNDAARSDPKQFVEQADASVTRRVEALVDLLAWVRIEMAATHPDGIAAPSDHERLQRALVQIEMALAMTKQLATELRRQPHDPRGE